MSIEALIYGGLGRPKKIAVKFIFSANRLSKWTL